VAQQKPVRLRACWQSQHQPPYHRHAFAWLLCSPRTREHYPVASRVSAKYTQHSPDIVSNDQPRVYIDHLAAERRLASRIAAPFSA